MSHTVYFRSDVRTYPYRPGITSDIWSRERRTRDSPPFALFRGLIVGEDIDNIYINVGSYLADDVRTVQRTNVYYSDDNLSEIQCVYESTSGTNYDELYETIENAMRENKKDFYRCTITDDTTRVRGHYWLTHKTSNEIIDPSGIRDYGIQQIEVPPDPRFSALVRNGVNGEPISMPFVYKSYGVIDATEVLQAKGKRVRLQGLSDKSLNGSVGTILRPLLKRGCETGRSAVILDGKQKAISVHYTKFVILDVPDLPVAKSSTDYRLHQLIQDPTRDSLSTSGRCFIEVSAACDLLQKPAEWNINYGTMMMEVVRGTFVGYDATYDIVLGNLPCARMEKKKKKKKKKKQRKTTAQRRHAKKETEAGGASMFILRF